MRAYFLTKGRKLQGAKQCPFCGRETTPGPALGLRTCNPCNELGDWFPTSLSYLLIGESGTGKSNWLYCVTDYYLNSASPRVPCVFVCLDDLPARVREQAAPYISDMAKNEAQSKLAFVDCYSSLAGAKSDERYASSDSMNLPALADLFTGLIRDGYRAFFVDSLTPLAALQRGRVLPREILALVARIKGHGGTVFLAAGSDLSEGTVHLRHFSDAVVEFRWSGSLTSGMLEPLGLTGWLRGQAGPDRKESRLREFRFYKARGRSVYPHWIPFVLGQDGVLIALPDDPAAIEQIKHEVKGVKNVNDLPKAA